VVLIPDHAEVKRPTLKKVGRACGIEDKAYRRAFEDLSFFILAMLALSEHFLKVY